MRNQVGHTPAHWGVINYTRQKLATVVKGTLAEANARARELADASSEAYGVYRLRTLAEAQQPGPEPSPDLQA